MRTEARARKLRLPATIALLAGLFLTVPAAGAPAAAGDMQIASRASGATGAKAGNESSSPKISADGRYVAFVATATNLDPADLDDTVPDIYVRDLQTRATTLVSRADGPAGAKGNAVSGSPAISADGRYVAFMSKATNLSPDKLDGRAFDVFLRDLQQHSTTLVSRASSGAKGNAGSLSPAISADGRVVAFESAATNLDPGDADTLQDVFVRNLRTGSGTTSLVSGPGAGPRTGESTQPSISADGNIVAFASTVTALHPDDADPPDAPLADIFTRDLRTGAITLVSRADTARGEKGNGDSESPAISGDGRLVAFSSAATNLDSADLDTTADIFVRNLALNTMAVVSLSDGLTGGKGDADSLSPAISQTGRFVIFTSVSAFDGADMDVLPDVYSREVVGGRTRLLSRAAGLLGAKANGPSDVASVSADARFVTYGSAATNLHPDDTDAFTDIFVRDALGSVAPLGPATGVPVGVTLPGTFAPAPASCPVDGTVTVLTDADDTRSGGSGTDILVGRRGADLLRGLGGRDCLYGEQGADRLFGGSGADRLEGGSGADRLAGQGGADALAGGAGNDALSGGAGNDALTGGAGADRLVDGRGRDRFAGGAGNDIINARDASRRGRRQRDRVTCGAGRRDRAVVDRRDVVARDCERVVRR